MSSTPQDRGTGQAPLRTLDDVAVSAYRLMVGAIERAETETELGTYEADEVNAYVQAWTTLDAALEARAAQAPPPPVDLASVADAFRSRLWSRLADRPGGLPVGQSEIADVAVAEALDVLADEVGLPPNEALR